MKVSKKWTEDELYKKWRRMMSVCMKPDHSQYKDYGEKGIKVCEEWYRFNAFRDWALAQGYKYETNPKGKLSLMRIDPNGDYNPFNCVFLTRAQKNVNKSTVILTYKIAEKIRKEAKDKKTSRKKLAEKYGVSYQYIHKIINKHRWAVDVFNLPKT
jgi:hypothetical protein